jgi:hypothetical protein
VSHGASAFRIHSVAIETRIDPARIDPAYIAGANFQQMAAEGLLTRLGLVDDAEGALQREVRATAVRATSRAAARARARRIPP